MTTAIVLPLENFRCLIWARKQIAAPKIRIAITISQESPRQSQTVRAPSAPGIATSKPCFHVRFLLTLNNNARTNNSSAGMKSASRSSWLVCNTSEGHRATPPLASKAIFTSNTSLAMKKVNASISK